MTRDDIRIVQSVLALNKPNMTGGKLPLATEIELRRQWRQIVDDMADSIRLANPRFDLERFLIGCNAEKDTTIW
jgi:hypothetical protein